MKPPFSILKKEVSLEIGSSEQDNQTSFQTNRTLRSNQKLDIQTTSYSRNTVYNKFVDFKLKDDKPSLIDPTPPRKGSINLGLNSDLLETKNQNPIQIIQSIQKHRHQSAFFTKRDVCETAFSSYQNLKPANKMRLKKAVTHHIKKRKKKSTSKSKGLLTDQKSQSLTRLQTISRTQPRTKDYFYSSPLKTDRSRHLNLSNISCQERSWNRSKDITDTIQMENERVAKQVDKIFIEETELVNESHKDTKKEFKDIYTKIRQLSSVLRRICKTGDEEPLLLEPNVCNSFDGIRSEIIPFKISCEKEDPPLKIKFLRASIHCNIYISQDNHLPNRKDHDIMVQDGKDMKNKVYYYYPTPDKNSFSSSYIYLGVECLSSGTVHILLKYQSEKLQNNFLSHTKSSVQLVSYNKTPTLYTKREYKLKIEALKYNEDKQKELLKSVEIIKNKRKEEFASKLERIKVRIPSRNKLYNYSSSREEQKFFNERRMKAVAEAQRRKELLDIQSLKIKMISANRKVIKEGLIKKFEQIKYKHTKRTLRATGFLKQMFLIYILRDMKGQFTSLRQEWLIQCKKHLMAFRIQRCFKAKMLKVAKEVPLRHQRTIQNCFKILSKTHTNSGILQKNMDFMKKFLLNTTNKQTINQRFISWYKKIILIQNFSRMVVTKKDKRHNVMKQYWKKITDVVDWNVCVGNKVKKLRQFDLLRLADIPEEHKNTVIKEYLKCYCQDRYQNFKEFLEIIDELPPKMKNLAVLKYHLLRIKNDDLLQFDRDKEYVDKTVQKGFEEIFATRKTKSSIRNSSSRQRNRKKQEYNFQIKLNEKQVIVHATLKRLDEKLYGLLVPQAGNFMPSFFEMIRLMVSIS
ncbi:unnamed protein product [Moneuplotes crassus]|uniref:Uncharacterized protein n=1 Tax=Euplotes crassus TaxID=5936 RepID=A0AAD1UM39_EUPCR|nr:unnamed protein product [Moneuplotes crassus]